MDPIDDLPPATIITLGRARRRRSCAISGISHDNGDITGVTVNGRKAECAAQVAGVVDWTIRIPRPADGKLTALAVDRAGNTEQTAHRIDLGGSAVASSP